MNITNNTINIDNINAYNNTPIPSKVCRKCNQIKPLTEYTKDKTKLDGLESSCKSCRCIKSKQYIDKNKQVNANKIFNKNDVRICPKCKKQKLYTDFYKCVTNPLGLAAYCKLCETNDPKEQFRQQFHKALNNAIKSNNTDCLPLTGCDPHFLKLWLEFQFDEKMNWGNYGTYFHIDHVKPRSLFNNEDDNDRRLMNHWSNLSPLEKYENITKSNKYNDEIEFNHTTKILRFLDHLNKTDPDLCKFATESYSNLS